MTAKANFEPIICIVGFHHARGPEIETWLGVGDGEDPATENDWSLLPFMALSDGAHAYDTTEDFSYFTLRRAATEKSAATSLFGISCTRQLDAASLISRSADITRSTVQKAVVVISESPQYFGALREKLSAVTKAWFAQRNFDDVEILKLFQESLTKSFQDWEDENDFYFGLSMRELIHEFKHQTLILFKCLLLQPKVLFFGSSCEKLCMMQFSLISLIPNLICKLQDCADPAFDNNERSMEIPTSVKTSDRSSLMAFVGLPLDLFGKGSLFGPYTPLQQLDLLADHGTRSYVVGSTNSLLLSQKDRYSDVLVNLDENMINISSPSLRSALTLSIPDRRWIDFLTQTVNQTWDDGNPSRPKSMGFTGSEEFIRLQFEEYLLALISSVRYKLFLEKQGSDPKALLADIEGDPSSDFNSDWISAWTGTHNFKIFEKFSDSHLFDIIEPKHPCAGGLTIDDVQRRMTQQITELHLDERIQVGRETLNKHLEIGQKRVTNAFGTLWADLEGFREAQRKRLEEQRASGSLPNTPLSSRLMGQQLSLQAIVPRTPDLSQAQASVQAASKSAGAYLSSWGAWAAEKRKTGWGRSISSSAKLGNSSNSNMTTRTTTNITENNRNHNSSNHITTITTGGDATQTSAATAAGTTTSIITANNNGNLNNSLNILSSKIKKSDSSSNDNDIVNTVTTSAITVKSAPPIPIYEKSPAPLQRQLHEPRVSESVSIGYKAEMGQPRKISKMVTALDEKEMGQEPERINNEDMESRDVTGKEHGKDEAAILTLKHKEVREESEVLFNGQEEEIPAVASTEEYDVSTAKKQRSSENETTNVINRSDATHDSASEPTEQAEERKGEGKTDVL